jgi:hypothetical protein
MGYPHRRAWRSWLCRARSYSGFGLPYSIDTLATRLLLLAPTEAF